MKDGRTTSDFPAAALYNEGERKDTHTQQQRLEAERTHTGEDFKGRSGTGQGQRKANEGGGCANSTGAAESRMEGVSLGRMGEAVGGFRRGDAALLGLSARAHAHVARLGYLMP